MSRAELPMEAARPAAASWAMPLFVVLAAALLAIQRHVTKFTLPIDDPFHFGEFLAPAISLIEGRDGAALPYTIHGLVDILPAYLLTLAGVPDHMLVGYATAFVPLMSVLAALLAAVAALRCAALFGVRPVAMLPFALCAGYLVAWRELFVCIGLILFAAVLKAIATPETRRTWLFVLFGVVSAFGIYWSFNRGAVMAVGLGVPLLFVIHRHRGVAIAIGTFALFVVVFGLTLPGTSLTHYFDNFLMLMETSSKWQQALSGKHYAVMGFIAALNGAAILAALWMVLAKKTAMPQTVLLAALALLSAFYVKIGLSRFDMNHLEMALWMPVLPLSLVFGAVAAGRDGRGDGLLKPVHVYAAAGLAVAGALAVYVTGAPVREILFPIALILLMALALPAFRVTRATALTALVALCLGSLGLALLRVQDSARAGAYGWVGDLAAAEGVATSDILGPGVIWAGEQLAARDAACTFDMVNAGLILAVSRRPACSQFTYPVYAGAEHEERLIADLKETRPAAIVYNSDFWSYTIDGLPMNERFPALEAEILALYPEMECNEGYCIRYQNSP
ncbi:hypothetical protein [Sagittula sp.]|uniref:hypothetical protein n=1 Tax=Sagittula sp. TaxID=2038081 RepID=UPI003512E39F